MADNPTPYFLFSYKYPGNMADNPTPNFLFSYKQKIGILGENSTFF